ncbi:MAG TPA: DUF3175 domain-containing protein, partial [Burkholderiales bacterium]|nr:DUF3175 domain-containing protein [Burkholderiales bacterium]
MPARARSRRHIRRWSGHVTKHSNALDLEQGVFRSTDPAHVA